MFEIDNTFRFWRLKTLHILWKTPFWLCVQYKKRRWKLRARKPSVTAYTAFKQNSTIRKISSYGENITTSKHKVDLFLFTAINATIKWQAYFIVHSLHWMVHSLHWKVQHLNTRWPDIKEQSMKQDDSHVANTVRENHRPKGSGHGGGISNVVVEFRSNQSKQY